MGLSQSRQKTWEGKFRTKGNSFLRRHLGCSCLGGSEKNDETNRQLIVWKTNNNKTVTVDDMNQNIRNMEYAVLGPIPKRAEELQEELDKGVKKPFTEVIFANVGDCHAMGQKPVTFIRQVLTLCTYPNLLKSDSFPSDVKRKAVEILKDCPGYSIGSYSNSAGTGVIRQRIAEYIHTRDGIPANKDDVFLGSGASDAIRRILTLLNGMKDGKPPGVMIPIPQYPLYSSATAEYGIIPINYYLKEDDNWAVCLTELKRAIDEAKEVCTPRAIVIINPGNPTGSVLKKENISEIIKFAYEQQMFIMADEVYQFNVYAPDKEFVSFKKVMTEMGEPYKSMELASFMSASKGYMGECGLRGGYCEVVNLDPEVKKMLLKCVSTRLCSSVVGQAVLYCVANPPQEGDPSYDIFLKEKTEVLQSLKERALMVEKAFNDISGIHCNPVEGAMYAFPKIGLPEKAIQKAQSLNQEPDFFFAMALLEATGICVIPGSGFIEIPGSYHFRTTILPQPEKLRDMLSRFAEFYQKFVQQYK